MNLIEIAFHLKKTALFKSLSLDELFTLAAHFDILEYKKQTPLFHTEHEATRLYILIEGKVQISNQKREPLATLEPPDYFGEEALFSKDKRGYLATAQTDIKVLVLMGSHFISIINQCPSVAINLLSAYASTLNFRPRP